MEFKRPSDTDRPYYTVVDIASERYELRCNDQSSFLSIPDHIAHLPFDACEPPARRLKLYNFLGTLIWAYEATIDSRNELPVFADLSGDPDTFELYILDPEGGEYISWIDRELLSEPNAAHAAITAVRDAYECPTEITENYPRTQAETLN
jgi:hypothetical protein